MPLIPQDTSTPGDTKRSSAYIPLLAYVVGVVLLVLAGYQAFRQIESLIQRDKLNDLNAIAAMKIGQIVSWRETQLRRGEVISQATMLPSTFEQWMREGARAESHKPKIVQMMSNWQQLYGYRTIALLDRQGAVRLSSNGSMTLDADDIAMVRQAMAGRRSVLSDIHYDNESGEISICLAAPLIVADDNSGRVVGAALLKINPGDFLFPLIQTWPTHSSTAETLLVRQEGENILFLNKLRHHQGKAMSLRLPLDTPNLPPGMFLRGKLDPLNSVDYRGVAVVASVSRIPGTTWLMSAKIDKEELFAPIVKLEQWSAGIGLAFLAGCGILLFVWLKGIQARYLYLKTQRDAAIHSGLLLKHFEYLTQYANDIILVADDNGEIIEANERAVSTYGYTRDELLGMQIWALRPAGDDLRVFHEQIVRFRKSGGLTFETTNRRKDGSIFPVEVSARIIELEGVKYLQGIIRDITERKAAERRVVRLNDLYAAISQTNSAIVRIKDQAALFQEICRIVVAHGHFCLAWVGLIDADNRYILPVAFSGPSAGYLDDMVIPIDAEKPEGQGPTGAALHQGLAVICNDFENDPRTLPWRDNARKYGLRSSASWPLRRHGKSVGVLNLYADEANFFDNEMVQLLTAVSQDTSFALDNLAMEEALRQSEEKFRTLVENLPQRIFVKDANLAYVSCNAIYARDKHIQPSEIVGKTDFDFYPQALAEKHRSYDRRVMAAGETEEMQEEYLVDGQARIIHIIKAPFKNPQGVVSGVLGVFWDVTERKRVEEKLRESEARFRSMADNAPIIIWMADAQDGQNYSGCGFFNQRWHDFTGLTLAQTQGRNWLELVHPDDRARCLEAYQDAFRLAQPFKHEFRLMRYDGEYRWMLDSGIPRFTEDGKFLGYIGTCIDISEQKETEALRGEIERAGRQDIAVEMASGLAHELSQPLAAANNYLTGCLHRMKDAEWDQKKLMTAVTLAHKQTERAGSIINHLKNIIRKQGHERSRADINALIRHTVNFLDLEIKRHGIVVFMVLSPLPWVKVSKIEIEQVLLNLLKNAIEAMQGAPEPLLRISTTDLHDSRQIQVTVSDNGHGIASAELATVFTPFHSSKTAGLGLGLAICRSLVENNGGRIWADAQQESGAALNFTLPYEEAYE